MHGIHAHVTQQRMVGQSIDLQAKTAWFGGIRRHLRIHPGADGCLEYDSIRLLFVILVIV